jgi:hypothetical protein
MLLSSTTVLAGPACGEEFPAAESECYQPIKGGFLGPGRRKGVRRGGPILVRLSPIGQLCQAWGHAFASHKKNRPIPGSFAPSSSLPIATGIDPERPISIFLQDNTLIVVSGGLPFRHHPLIPPSLLPQRRKLRSETAAMTASMVYVSPSRLSRVVSAPTDSHLVTRPLLVSMPPPPTPVSSRKSPNTMFT